MSPALSARTLRVKKSKVSQLGMMAEVTKVLGPHLKDFKAKPMLMFYVEEQRSHGRRGSDPRTASLTWDLLLRKPKKSPRTRSRKF